jgi:uncharacterized protein (TIGR03437 family)
MITRGLVTFGLIAASWASAQTITVRSGNGPVGGPASEITFLLGPPSGPFNHTFASADFASARSGPDAFIVSPNPLWISGLPSDPSAQWIGTNTSAGVYQGNTALYAISFQITSAFSSATMTLNYSVDDGIGASGDPLNTGVYLNGTPICGNSFPIGFSQAQTVNCSEIGAQLQVGTNWLYIEDVNAVVSPAGLLLSATITTNPSNNGNPSIDSGGVVNVASYAPGPVSPGSVAAVFGSFPISTPVAVSGIPLPTSLSGLSIQFSGGVQAPMYYASGSQVNIQVPWGLAGQTSLTATVNDKTSAPQTLNLASFAPGIFSMNGQGTGQGAVLDSQNNLVDASNPTTAGAAIQIFCTGLGPVTNQPPTGVPAPSSPLAETTMTPTVTIGGSTAQVLFSGLSPGNVGLYQVNVPVPAGIAAGTSVPVVISRGAASSNTVTIAVGPLNQPNPQPLITSLSPALIQAGSGPLTLTINGSGFISSSSVTFDGVPHTPSFVNGSQLGITLSVSDLAAPGSFPVIVSNPTPGGGSSNAAFLLISSSTPINPNNNVAGAWQGTWSSTLGQNGSVTANLTQTGNLLSGTISFSNWCSTTGNIAGTISGNQISLTLSFPTGQKVSFSGGTNAPSNAITGQYTVTTGSCIQGSAGGLSLGKL